MNQSSSSWLSDGTFHVSFDGKMVFFFLDAWLLYNLLLLPNFCFFFHFFVRMEKKPHSFSFLLVLSREREKKKQQHKANEMWRQNIQNEYIQNIVYRLNKFNLHLITVIQFVIILIIIISFFITTFHFCQLGIWVALA